MPSEISSTSSAVASRSDPSAFSFSSASLFSPFADWSTPVILDLTVPFRLSAARVDLADFGRAFDLPAFSAVPESSVSASFLADRDFSPAAFLVGVFFEDDLAVFAEIAVSPSSAASVEESAADAFAGFFAERVDFDFPAEELCSGASTVFVFLRLRAVDSADSGVVVTSCCSLSFAFSLSAEGADLLEAAFFPADFNEAD